MSFTRTLRVVGSTVVAGALLFGTAPIALADQVREDQWPLKAFKAEEIRQITKGEGVTVAVIDDGVDAGHQDLKGNVLEGRDFIDGGSAAPEGNDDHGTAMAGIIAAHGHGPGASQGVMGLAPEAKILPIRDDGSQGQGVGPAIRYAVDHGASIINISQGSSTTYPEDRDAIAYAWKHDVLVVAGSGNSGKGPGNDFYPAYYPGVAAVGGVSRSGEIWKGSNYSPEILLTAPATGIVSSGGGSESFPYRKGTGTSDSSAYVSASAALIRAKFPDLTAGQVLNRLVKTAGLPASAKGLSLPDDKYGYGFIQPLAALKRDIPAGSKNGPLKTPEGASSAPSGPSDSAPNPGSNNSAEDESGMSLLPIALGLAVLVIVAVVVIVLVVRKNRRNGPPPGGPGGYYGPPGAPGYPPHQPSPYQHQPTPPGAYPPGPPTHPPGH